VRHLQIMLQLGGPPREGWAPPILRTVASQAQGIAEVADAAEAHLRHLQEQGLLADRERSRLEREFNTILQDAALRLVRERYGEQAYQTLLQRLLRRELDPYAAAEELLKVLDPTS
jgi:LAO/AO transport system kinase